MHYNIINDKGKIIKIYPTKEEWDLICYPISYEEIIEG